MVDSGWWIEDSGWWIEDSGWWIVDSGWWIEIAATLMKGSGESLIIHKGL